MLNIKLEDILKDTNQIIRLLHESLASKKAKKLGLVHIGFGNYAKAKGSPAEYRTIDGKLTKLNSKSANASDEKIRSGTSTDFEVVDIIPKKKNDDDIDIIDSNYNKIKNLKRVTGGEYDFQFDRAGKRYRFSLTKPEIERFIIDGTAIGILLDRFKKRNNGIIPI